MCHHKIRQDEAISVGYHLHRRHFHHLCPLIDPTSCNTKHVNHQMAAVGSRSVQFAQTFMTN
ncbi:hypothetical protein I314_06510 [Cryptococcus bacillisporus CA1873]|uniref:Uncharacterized protein n=1 Tax=Cryptococcus bacillisporus CA1873 TaxID=1296111 RepID=A0ABR5B208_CRYGA|nr:hypothetical protein I314_06510 [Cryptococcus bacillisporus CA1873]|eukprot:KIR57618.1 hypothetical protein I314_06510 [Cryptococcus gattii CA1873]